MEKEAMLQHTTCYHLNIQYYTLLYRMYIKPVCWELHSKDAFIFLDFVSVLNGIIFVTIVRQDERFDIQK